MHKPRKTFIPYRPVRFEAIKETVGDHNIRTFLHMDCRLQRKLDHSNCIYKTSCKKCSIEYIGQTCMQSKIRIADHKRKAKSWPIDRMSLSKLEHNAAVALPSLVESYLIDYDKNSSTWIPSNTERLYAEAMLISPNGSKRSSRNSQHLDRTIVVSKKPYW